MLLLCLKIFFIRILDVSLGTIRTIITVKGKTIVASIIGFIELFVWFVIVKEAINTEETSLFVAFSYAGGFAVGTFLGSILSQKFIQGTLNVQIITSKPELIEKLRDSGYAVSVMDIKGQDISKGKYMLFIGINNRSFDHLKEITQKIDSKAFIVVNETKYVQNGFIK